MAIRLGVNGLGRVGRNFFHTVDDERDLHGRQKP